MGKAAEGLIRGYQTGGYAKEDVLATVKELEKQAGVTVRGTWKVMNARLQGTGYREQVTGVEKTDTLLPILHVTRNPPSAP